MLVTPSNSVRTVRPATEVANHKKVREVSYTRDRKSRTEYIAREDLREVRAQIVRYKRFKALTTQWTDLGIEHSRLKMKLKPRR